MSDSELEEELRALRPARPLARLEEAIARELAPSRAVVLRPASGVVKREGNRSRFQWWPSLSWAAVGAVAALAVTMLPLPWNQPADPLAQKEVALFEPVESVPEIISAEDGEVSYDGEDGPTQLVRYSSIQRQTWANPVTGAQIEIVTPREDIFLVPVSYQ